MDEPSQSTRAKRFSGLLKGLMFRSRLTDCPLGAFQVEVVSCSGSGDCSSVCFVKVFETDKDGKCVVANQELCFGCMACVAQCMDHGIVISETEAREYLPVEELLK